MKKKYSKFEFCSLIKNICFVVEIIVVIIFLFDKNRLFLHFFCYALVWFIGSLYFLWYQIYFYIKGDIEKLHTREYYAGIAECFAFLFLILFIAWNYLTGKL